MGFIRTIIIIGIIYFVFKFIFRYLLPFLVRRQVNKMTDLQDNRRADDRNEGDVTINKGQQKNIPGEYTDYEEVD